jgi:hypothetical protein
MSILSIAFPFESAVMIGGVVAGAARPLLGLGAFASLLLYFKPLLKGLFKAALLFISPRKSLEERRLVDRVRSARMLQRLACDYDRSQPNLANELRQLASRD